MRKKEEGVSLCNKNRSAMKLVRGEPGNNRNRACVQTADGLSHKSTAGCENTDSQFEVS